MGDSPRAIIISGPNGAGKTTFAEEFLPHEADCPVFVNADRIAAGLAPLAPAAAAVRAGRIMLEEMSRHFTAGRSFAIESTLAGRGYLRLIDEWQRGGYQVKLIFLQLSDPAEAIARVRQRVRQGGHDVADDVVRRRFAAGLKNFEHLYKPRVDAWVRYDNSGNEPIAIEWSEKI